MSHPLIAPVVRRFVDLRESIDYRVGILRRNSPFAAHLEIAADRRELDELSRLPQVREFLALERERGESPV